MKKFFNYILILAALVQFTGCSDDLDTEPTDRISGSVLFKDIDGAMVAMNGIYRNLYTSGWTSGNTHQNFGILSTNLYTDLMGEDLLQAEQGNGWFYFDYKFNVRSRYNNTAWRPYATWNFYYTLISNSNYVIAAEQSIVADQVAKDNVIGQALAMRAYCYFMLIQSYQQTYIGHKNAPGVPLYTEPTTASSQGKGRGTVQEVYDQINSDINLAISKLEASKGTRSHKSHVDYYVANAFKARIAMVQNKWSDALAAANEAMKMPGAAIMQKSNLTSGFNSVDDPSVLWGAQIIADQSTIYASFFSHMDSEATGMYGEKSRKCISSWLYEQVPAGDARKAWWAGKLTSESSSGPNKSYNQFKFRFKNKADYTGDYIFMRFEEMLLIAAEAKCRLDDFAGARENLTALNAQRFANYADRLDGMTDSKDYTLTYGSYGTITTLMDEIMVQRRIELWGEGGRIFDILRLKTGFTRDFPNSNHSDKLTAIETTKADCKDFILTIPQTEFDGNTNLNSATDQNPL